MSLTQLDSVAIDFAGSGTRTLMLCQGDLTKMAPQDAVDFIAVSALPGDYSPTPGSLIGALAAAGVSVQQQSQNKAANYEPTMPCWVSQDVSSAGLNFNRFILFEPPAPTATSAPFDVFTIYRALLCFTGGTATSIALPMVSTGSGGADFATILRQLFFMGAHWASLYTWPVSVVKLVVYDPSQVPLAQQMFTAMKQGYLNPPMSIALPQSFGAYSSQLGALGTLPANMTQRQYNCIQAYTGNSVYPGLNAAMRKGDLTAPDYIYWLPTIEGISSGLAGLPPYAGLTLRGTNLYPPIINQYQVGATVIQLAFTSSTLNSYAFPGNTMMRITSVQGKDIEAISVYPSEREVLYDYNMTDLVASTCTQSSYTYCFNLTQTVPNWCGS